MRRVNVSNHYSKKHDARHSCTFAKALKTPQRPLARASELHCLVTENQKPRSFLLKSSNVDSADSNEVLLWQKHQDKCHRCLVWNLNLCRASHLTSDLGKTNAFAMVMNVLVEDSRTFFAREDRSSTRKSQTFMATGSCLSLSLFGKK